MRDDEIAGNDEAQDAIISHYHCAQVKLPTLLIFLTEIVKACSEHPYHQSPMSWQRMGESSGNILGVLCWLALLCSGTTFGGK